VPGGQLPPDETGSRELAAGEVYVWPAAASKL